MKRLRRIYYKLFPVYKRIDMQSFSWEQGDLLIRQNAHKPLEEQWHIAPEEDLNRDYDMVFLEKKIRITE